MSKLTFLHEKTNKKRHELYAMIAVGSCYEGVRKCLINFTNGITENISTKTWMLGVGGTSFKTGTVTVQHNVKCNIQLFTNIQNN